jgi:hypothetical protein
LTDIHRKPETRTIRQTDRQTEERQKDIETQRKTANTEKQKERETESFIRHRETTGRANRLTKEKYRTRCTAVLVLLLTILRM